jgi:hypothetical protein
MPPVSQTDRQKVAEIIRGCHTASGFMCMTDLQIADAILAILQPSASLKAA